MELSSGDTQRPDTDNLHNVDPSVMKVFLRQNLSLAGLLPKKIKSRLGLQAKLGGPFRALVHLLQITQASPTSKGHGAQVHSPGLTQTQWSTVYRTYMCTLTSQP